MRKALIAGLPVAVTLLSSAAFAAPRTHDGFQFRGAVGGGYLSDSVETTGTVGPFAGTLEGTIKGAAGAFEAYFGGTPARGLVIGGFFGGASAAGPKFKGPAGVEVSDDDTAANLLLIGPYVNWYPDARTGFHLLGSLFLAAGNITYDRGDEESETATGGGIGLGLGYDWWVSDEWSLGVLGRFSYASIKWSDGPVEQTHSIVYPGLFFSFQYH